MVALIKGPGSLDCIPLSHESGDAALISLYSGHLLSWSKGDGAERLFVSDTSAFGGGKAIRGGVPVIFPQFSDRGPFGRHGFARNRPWELSSYEGNTAELSLVSDAETLKLWPHEFRLRLTVILETSQITLHLSVENTDSEPFDFSAALHTYFSVTDSMETRVEGLEGLCFEDNFTKEQHTQPEEAVGFTEPVDRIYFGAGSRKLFLIDCGVPVLEVRSEEFTDSVVWNPGSEHGLGDLAKDGWRSFVCVEAAAIEPLLTLKPGQSWSGRQVIRDLRNP